MKKILFFLWVILALGSLFYFSNYYALDIPVFTLIWLIVTFLMVLISGEEKYAGFSRVKIGEFFFVFILNLLFLSIIFIIVEPLSNTYKNIIDLYIINPSLNPAYFWLNQYNNINGLLGFFFINIFIVVFAEEIFFRGFILQYVGIKLSKFWAVLIQAFLYLLFIVLLNIELPPVESYIYLVGYSFIGRGIIGGWAASRTDSIWPPLISVSLVYTAVIFMYFFYPIF